MGASQPYLYNPPTTYNFSDPYNGFNPKRISQASILPPRSPPKPKQKGPLLTFNRHPDSYLAPPYGRTDVVPMHKNSKKRIITARKVQLGLRVLTLVGAIGLVFSVICIKIPKLTEGWIVRLPPALDVLMSLYGAYNMMQKPTAKAPASNASYQGFAALIDASLLPFYIFTALLGSTYRKIAPGTKNRWESRLGSVESTNRIIQVTWIAASTIAGVHVISLALDMYLLIMYRKVSLLPPDMNPLEDNLTSRRKFKHKHKHSEIMLVTDKHLSNISGTTAATAARTSYASDARTISFRQSRFGEDGSYSPHNPKTARLSMYQQQAVDESSAHLHRRTISGAESGYSNRTSAMPAQPTMSKRSPTLASPQSQDHYQVSSSYNDVESDNWFVISEDTDHDYDAGELAHAHTTCAPPPPAYTHENRPLPEISHYINRSVARTMERPEHMRKGHPLRMNPPSPEIRNNPTPPPKPITPVQASDTLFSPLTAHSSHTFPTTFGHDEMSSTTHRSRTMLSANSLASASSSNYSTDEFGSHVSHRDTMPPPGLYGDPTRPMRGVRQDDFVSPRPKSLVASLHWTHSDITAGSDVTSNPASSLISSHSRTMPDNGAGTIVRRLNVLPVSPLLNDDGEDDIEDENEHEYGHGHGHGYGYGYGQNEANENIPLGRSILTRGSGYVTVVDRSDANVDQIGDRNRGRGRDVSGKIVEEGRAGVHTGAGWRSSGVFRRTSGIVAS